MARHTEDPAEFSADFPADGNDGADSVCPLCSRPIPPDVPQSLHHLVPKAKGGKRSPQILLHEICHLEIHASLSDADLAHKFNTIEA
ncbi:MAG: HNH endonuclease, partial [Paracoccaceae bacterium]|nr:HNH endonuclease [Paracoccaceae bacterium]